MRAGEDRRGGRRRGDDEYDVVEAASCCSCLPFCGLWGSRTRRRRRRFRLRLIRLSWFSWPWRKNSGKKKKKKTTTTTAATKEAKGMKKRMLLLLSSSSSSSSPPSPAKKALAASVSAAAAAGSLLLPKVSSFADGGKKQRKSGSTSLPRQTVGGGGGDADAAAPAKDTTPPARLETTDSWQRPCTRPAGVKRAPSRRHGSFRREPGGGGGGLWTMATTLGVIVFFGRVTAVAFLCSCLYAARFVRAQAAGAAAVNGTRGGGGSGRFGEPAAAVEVDVCTEEHKKKVVMQGLLDRGGKRFSSRFL
uniref:Uncharacterized protein n=1 Tax=Oryza punctata TaxID=4537 RepID=A0A0E0M8Z9_ORYPU